MLPRGYLSWSQLRLWESSPETYVKQYIYGGPRFTNRGMEIGKEFAEAVEHGSDREDINFILASLEIYDEVEEKISATIEGFELLGYKDTSQKGKFREYKTGKTKWTQNKANKHGQLAFYATIDQLNGLSIPQVHLDWIPTDGFNFTGEIISYEVVFTEEDIDAMKERIVRACGEISERYQEELSNLI